MSTPVISILVDSPDNWIIPYVEELIRELESQNYTVRFIQHHSDIQAGDIAFFLGCRKIVPLKMLLFNKHNLVVHESALPQGKGWSPLTWQILEGKNEIPVTLFEATEEIDHGCIYFQEKIIFEGDELLGELHQLQGKKTIALCLKFVKNYPNVVGIEQQGSESFYPRRRPVDSKIDVNKTIAELFNNFRVADNDMYPVFFEHKGKKYTLTINKMSEEK